MVSLVSLSRKRYNQYIQSMVCVNALWLTILMFYTINLHAQSGGGYQFYHTYIPESELGNKNVQPNDTVILSSQTLYGVGPKVIQHSNLPHFNQVADSLVTGYLYTAYGVRPFSNYDNTHPALKWQSKITISLDKSLPEQVRNGMAVWLDTVLMGNRNIRIELVRKSKKANYNIVNVDRYLNPYSTQENLEKFRAYYDTGEMPLENTKIERILADDFSIKYCCLMINTKRINSVEKAIRKLQHAFLLSLGLQQVNIFPKTSIFMTDHKFKGEISNFDRRLFELHYYDTGDGITIYTPDDHE